MKSVLISIQPRWCDLIARRKKTVEVRKTKPKFEVPFKVYIYCTNDKKGWFDFGKKERLDGKVIGEFVCDYVSIFRPKSLTCESAIKKASCLTVQGLIDYAGNKNHIFGWHISDLVIYNKPKVLNEFISNKALSYEDWLYGVYSGGSGSKGNYNSYLNAFKLKRPPQSWCYVKEEEK